MAPDFIIGGAPKCGTTSLHHILHDHPGAWVARGEIYYFDADDAVAHADFLSVEAGRLVWRDPGCDAMRDWYQSKFADAPPGLLTGDDSTTYLMSIVAPSRIADMLPKVKVIFMLRDPVRRAYSQYWHLVRSGRTTLSLEAALSAEPSILAGSTYAPQLRRYFDALGCERVHVVLFEEFNDDRQTVMNGITGFLGLPDMQIDAAKGWQNRTRYPRRTRTLLALNWVGRLFVRYRYTTHFDGRRPLHARLGNRAYRAWFGFISARILTRERPQHPMRPKTQNYLERHLSDRNAGLSALLDRDLGAIWPGFLQ